MSSCLKHRVPRTIEGVCPMCRAEDFDRAHVSRYVTPTAFDHPPVPVETVAAARPINPNDPAPRNGREFEDTGVPRPDQRAVEYDWSRDELVERIFYDLPY